MPLPILAAALAAALGLGLAAGYYARYLHALSRRSSLELELQEQTLAAERKAIEVVERAEAKAEDIEREAKAERAATETKLTEQEAYLRKREEVLDNRQIDLDSQREAVQAKIDEVKSYKEQLDARRGEIDDRLAAVAGMTREEAYQELTETLERERAADISTRLRKLETAGTAAYEARARDLLLCAIHRVGNQLPPNVMTANVELPNDEVKGKVIGKEGRNVRAFERATGVDLLVDDTPGYIVLSSFDPIRREIARVALEQLLKDGRIQPARIEETVEEARRAVADTVREQGERAAFEAQVPNLPSELLTILGRLHFRTSYGQNVLWHSVEMAHLAGIIAAEVGADVATARAGALLHDIGKAVSHEVAGTHVDIGIRILQKYEVDERVIKAMRAHHEEYPYETPESIIVQVADAISSSRPGARRDSIENYIKRLSDLESIATTLSGVEKAFAIAAGREVRVLVNPHELSEVETQTLARTIAANIEQQLRYPGEIKVHVIRETRVTSYAR